MVHVPEAMKLAVAPETVQTVGVVEEKVTERPELAVAERASCVPAIWPGIAPKEMVWDSPFTVKLCETGLAAA